MSAALEPLTELVEGVIVRPMLTLDDAIDFACAGLAAKTRADYGRLLYRFADQFPRHWDVARVSEDDCLRFLNRGRQLARSTRAWQESVLASFFRKLYLARKIKRDPMEFVPRTRRPAGDELDLVTVSAAEVARMFEAAESWPERLCLAVLAYLGPRRHAAALLTLRDYDRERGRLRFREKGDKTIWKPVPDELQQLLEGGIAAGVISSRAPFQPADPYLIPPRRPVTKTPRNDRCVWELVKLVSARAGVEAHTHSLRAAFADFYLDSGGDGKALQLLLGHSSPVTTERYTRRYDRERRMEGVRALAWSAVSPGNEGADRMKQIAAIALEEPSAVGAGGFEPPFAEPAGLERSGSLRRTYREAELQ